MLSEPSYSSALNFSHWDAWNAGIVFGLVNHITKNVRMNPAPSEVVEHGDELLIIRPTCYRTGTYKPAPSMKAVDAGED